MESPNYILSLIVEGYYSHSKNDRFVFVHNPKYLKNDLNAQSEDSYIMYDTWRDNYDEDFERDM